MNMLDQVCFSSFVHKHKNNLEQVRRELNLEQALQFGFLMWQVQDFVQYLDQAHNGDTLNIDVELLLKHESFILEEMAKARQKNLKIKFYFGFDIEETDEIYKRLEDLCVDALILNHPMKSLAYLAQLAC